ncbi:serine hydrolase domain-containing protein [Desertivirga brevis]|uniref:serine hydrolase domain-containing protein n=1 Tax=Desertivirga brevis TaxID=2810310 RepID=UPI001A974672|nr:serine hydrolase [Pedobacter sp. SYSU D00873]
MRKLSLQYFILFPLIIASLFIFLSAELPHKDNQSWLDEAKRVESSTVLLRNAPGLVPIKDIVSNRIASVNIGFRYALTFDSLLNKFAKVDKFSSSKYTEALGLDKLNTDLKLYQTVIVQLTDSTVSDPGILHFILDLSKSKSVLLVLFGEAQSLKHLDNVEVPVIWTAEKSEVSATHTAQLVFGGVESKARLSTTVSRFFKKGDGFEIGAIRLKYTVPEELGIRTEDLALPVDKIMSEALTAKATPGAVVMVVKDGKVIFNKSYGSHTYSSKEKDKVEDIFDLASVTKISATTIAAMRLCEQGKIDLNQGLGTYLPIARSTTKNDLTLKELMLHEGGLTPFIPFYRNIKPVDFNRDSSGLYSVKVADGYYLRKNYYEEVMLPQMLRSSINKRGKYEYSDLSMYFLKEAIERQSALPLNQYVEREFYQPLGMQTAGFNPRMRFPKSRIIPTEQDLLFRKTLLEGYVHDQGAAMAGGVAGHAGLFASSNDLAILFQMILNGGTYGGVKYFEPSTISLFTSRQSETSRRGLGFDRWDPETGTYPSKLASPQTFGHTGYTGTCVWVDPQYKLIYIFLSNRVNPQVSDKLSTLKIRPRIQDAIYEALRKART